MTGSRPEGLADWPWVISAPTLIELLDARVAATPDRICLIDEAGAKVTFADFRARVDRVAAALFELGIRPGSRVAWQLPTRIGTALVLTALRRLGAVQSPIIHLYREREVTAALEASRAEFFLVPSTWRGFDFAAMARSLSLTVPPVLVEIDHDAPESADTSLLPPIPTDPFESTFIYFTSGSTGRPKGARHTDDSIVSTGILYAGIGRFGRAADEVGGAAFPFGHVGGVIYFVTAIAAGFPILLLETFVPAAAAEQFREHKVTTTGGATPFYHAFLGLARANPGTPVVPYLRTLKGGGAPCPPNLVHEVREELGAILAHDYGMTEVPMIAVSSPDDPIEILTSAEGRIVPGLEVRLVDLSDEVAPPGADGEIQVRGRPVFTDYLDPADTAAAFTDDGWFRTGDIGRIHGEDVLEVVGRSKDLIIRKGENIAPQEIEELLSRHPEVAEVAVIGLPDSSDRGEMVCAVVVPVSVERAPTLESVTGFLIQAGLMRQKLPERLEIVEELPRTGLAKVAKRALTERFAASLK
ncbi:MAG: putative cyclohex-ene-carboxylate:CoA ligase [Pseudonocardiales bacterium]|nr:putative cyclohex-ene-carboxylate:CoA ligase [Pseudonocardiales bacterium]